MTTPCNIYNNAGLILSLTTLFRLITPLKAIRQRPLRVRVLSVMVILHPVVQLYLSTTPHTPQIVRCQLHPAVHLSNRSQLFLADFPQLIATHLDKITLFH